MMIALPLLHAELEPNLPEGARLLDPGLGLEGRVEIVQPPLDPQAVAALLAEVEHLDVRYGSPEELAQAFSARAASLDSERSSQALAAELSTRLRGGGEKPAQTVQDTRRRAQCALLLAWTLEQRVLDLAALEKDVKAGQETFNAKLGFSDQDETDARELGFRVQAGSPEPDVADLLAAWPAVLAAVAALCPGATFFSRHPAVVADWLELGLQPSPAAGADSPSGLGTGTLSASALVGSGRAQAFGLSGNIALAAPMELLLPANA